jgi:hypothetical protein
MDIKAYVRGLDREEEELRAQIMRIQVRIQQLHDMRVLMMHRAEEHAAVANQPSPFGMFNGAEIAVRDPTLMLAASEAGQLSQAAKTGAAALPDKRQYTRPDPKGPMTQRALEVIKAAGKPIATYDIREALGILHDKPASNRLNGALNTLKTRRVIDWDKAHRYFPVKGAKLMARTEAISRRRKEKAEALDKSQSPLRQKVENLIASQPDGIATAEIITGVYGEGQPSKPQKDAVYNILHSIRTRHDHPRGLIFDGEVYRPRAS